MMKNRDLTPAFRNLKSLARRAVACRGWRWMPGMLAVLDRAPPLRILEICDAGNALQEARWLPDLSDPATRGWLLELVREALADPELFARREIGGSGWVVIRSNSVRPIRGATEAEALVAALEAAP